MNRETVHSSNIQSIGYESKEIVEDSFEGQSQHIGELEVEFKSGDVYRYKKVPKEIYDALMIAPSKGQFLNAFVKSKPYKYPVVKIEKEKEI